MSPRKLAPVGPPVTRTLDRIAMATAVALREERRRRDWTLRELAGRAGVSVAAAHAAESGDRVSLEMYASLAHAFGLRLDLTAVDPRRRAGPSARIQDPVHSAMGELEAARLRSLGYTVAIDEPYQHYQFAGRADLLAWDLDRRALLHLENRTRFPNVGETAGAWNAKRAYLAPILAERLGIGRWTSITHAMVALWSAEVLHIVRLRSETFRSLCPDAPDAFTDWWSGVPPIAGTAATLVLLDPFASGRARRYAGMEDALSVRPRMRGYAEAATRLGSE
jgi:transcriptional regulator with XRE-family HTH domain